MFAFLVFFVGLKNPLGFECPSTFLATKKNVPDHAPLLTQKSAKKDFFHAM